MSFPARPGCARLLLAAVLAVAPACAALAADETYDDENAEYGDYGEFNETPLPFTGEEVRQAAARTRADLERPVNRPREEKPRKKERESSLSPMTGLEEALRLAMWVLGGVIVIFVLLNLHRWIRVRGAAQPRKRSEPLPPGSVSGLDIRPASMPEDVAAQAARLWREGQGRAALALLYRAALSRLVHAHAVPIRSASTEKECVALSARVLPAPSAAFFAGLVGAWQSAAYGASLPDAARMQALFDDFERMLPRAAAAESLHGRPATEARL
ncbi:DUF4129 domain-containing protein [Bordetella genomosp. 13]|uniref:DUF4129 domain-containing protein n=1 Tax=Bordetella genomosp. 13 TaxID=463040 RepID=UPI0021B565DD|nr:DUF4129 domain-containing protein [Bordetella genomosp. 13]